MTRQALKYLISSVLIIIFIVLIKQEMAYSSNFELPEEYKLRITRIENMCQKYLGVDIIKEKKNIDVPSHIQFLPKQMVRCRILLGQNII